MLLAEYYYNNQEKKSIILLISHVYTKFAQNNTNQRYFALIWSIQVAINFAHTPEIYAMTRATIDYSAKITFRLIFFT